MPRRTPPERIPALLEVATRVFIGHGYRLAQMSDVARELGVAKGTLYLYVESKDALFDHALRFAAGELVHPEQLPLPLAERAPGALRNDLVRVLADVTTPSALARGLPRRASPKQARESLEAVLRELFGLLTRYRDAIKLIDRCRTEHPELGDTFYREGRMAQLRSLADYLAEGMRRGTLRDFADPIVATRFVYESLATWAVHIHWDPAPQAIDPAVAEETLIQMLLAALLPPG